MTLSRGPTLRLRACGWLACFTRPELKVERVSYPVITPSAARGLLEAVLWKPAMRWQVERISVLKPIRFIGLRRNEVSTKASAPANAVVRGGGTVLPYFADDDRAQRNTLALCDVDYVVEAHFELTDRAGETDTVRKFTEMFERRLEKGQTFHQPYFGCREMVADVGPAESAPEPIDDSRDLGLMLWDIDYRHGRNRPIFFPARLERGVLSVPSSAEDAARQAVAAGGAA